MTDDIEEHTPIEPSEWTIYVPSAATIARKPAGTFERGDRYRQWVFDVVAEYVANGGGPGEGCFVWGNQAMANEVRAYYHQHAVVVPYWPLEVRAA